MTFKSGSVTQTLLSPYVAGRIIIERAMTDKTKIGIASFVKSIDDSTPISDDDLENDYLYQKANLNPQSNIFSLRASNSIIYFDSPPRVSGTFTRDTLTYTYSLATDSSARFTLTATK